MDNNEYKELQDKIDHMHSELDNTMLEFKANIYSVEKADTDLTELKDIIAKFKAKVASLEQADAELEEKIDQLDAELGFWDTISKKNINNRSKEQEKI